MRNLITFVLAVADTWFFWIGIALMIEPFLEGAWPRFYQLVKAYFVKHPDRRRKIFRTLGIIALFFAFFQAWNAQYEAAGLNKDRVAMKALIADALNESDKLQENWWIRTDDDQFTHETNIWINKVGSLIDDAYGKGEATAWNSDAGVSNFTDGKKHTDLHNAIANRATRLKELIPRIDSLPMREGFDPNNYHWVTECKVC